MSAVDRSGLVTIVLGGSVATVPYRRAVGLIATGRANWGVAPEEAAGPVKPKQSRKSRETRVETPVNPVQPVLASESGPGLSDLPSGRVYPSVSTPARKGAEGDLTGNEPSPIDP